MPGNNEKNLISLADRSTEEQREIARKGGIASGKARREKKILSDIYAGILQKKFKVIIDGVEQTVMGSDFLESTIKKILSKANRTTVSMIKEIRQATEGNTVHIVQSSDLAEYTDIELLEMEKELEKEIKEKSKI